MIAVALAALVMSADPGPTTAPSPASDDASLSLSLDALGVEVSWSGYGDATANYTVPDDFNLALNHFNFIPLVRLHETVWLDMELEIENVKEINVEFAEILWQPSPLFRLSGGKLLVPIGRYSPEYHPSFRWPQVSEPLMMAEVIPSAWSEVGVGVAGVLDLFPGSTLEYNAFVTNGAALTDDQEHESVLARVLPLKGVPAPLDEPTAAVPAEEGEAEGGPIRVATKNGPVVDNNLDKGLGARLRYNAQLGELVSAQIDTSAYTASPDAAQRYRFSVVDVDVETHVGPVVFRAEAAQSFLSSYGFGTTVPLERGLYAQLVLNAPDVIQWAVRFDFVDEKPDFAGNALREATAVSVSWLAFSFLRLRTEFFVPFDAKFHPQNPSVLGMVAWSF